MPSLSFCAVLLFAAAFALSALAAPAPDHGDPRLIELREVLNRSVCPIKVEIDDDPNRIPRRIKMLKCARSPNPMCATMTHACCHHHHHKFNTECVEVRDHVLVSYRDAPAPVSVPVFVGCTCMVSEAAPAVPDAAR